MTSLWACYCRGTGRRPSGGAIREEVKGTRKEWAVLKSEGGGHQEDGMYNGPRKRVSLALSGTTRCVVWLEGVCKRE